MFKFPIRNMCKKIKREPEETEIFLFPKNTVNISLITVEVPVIFGSLPKAENSDLNLRPGDLAHTDVRAQRSPPALPVFWLLMCCSVFSDA